MGEYPVYLREVGWFDSPSAYQSWFLVSGSLLPALINKYLEINTQKPVPRNEQPATRNKQQATRIQ